MCICKIEIKGDLKEALNPFIVEKTAKANPPPHRVAYTVPEVQMLNHFPFSKDPFKMKKGIGESEIESCVQSKSKMHIE